MYTASHQSMVPCTSSELPMYLPETYLPFGRKLVFFAQRLQLSPFEGEQGCLTDNRKAEIVQRFS
jgi:hypothetical protein